MEAAPAPVLHESLHPLKWLIGKWRSAEQRGHGTYPTIEPFSYCEEMSFEAVGRQPVLNYHSTTWHPERHTPMHLESGFLRADVGTGTRRVAFMVAHNFGVTSLEEGTVPADDRSLRLTSTGLTRMSFAAKEPQVLAIEREYKLLDNGQLEGVVSMRTSKMLVLTQHLKIVYDKCL